MVASERRISVAQLFTVIFILGMSLKMLMLPVLLLKSSGRDSVLGMSGILLSELLCLGACIAAILLAPQKSFTELLENCVGKIAAKIVFVLLALFFFGKLVLISGEVRIFFSENLFGEFPWRLYGIPFFGLCIVMGMGTLRAIGRSAQFLFPFIAVATFVMFVLIAGGVDFHEVFPIGEFGYANVFRASYKFAMWYGDYSLLVVCLGAVKRSRHTVAISLTAGILSACVVLFFMFGLTATFSNVCNLIRFGQNVTGMSHYALGNIMQGRVDLVLFCVWLISVFIKAGMFSFAVVFFVRAVLPVGGALPSVLLGLALYIISVCTPSATSMHSFMTQYLSIPALIFQIAVPALMLGVVLVARHKDKTSRIAGEKDGTAKAASEETENGAESEATENKGEDHAQK